MFYGLRNLINLELEVYCFINIYGIMNLFKNLFLFRIFKVINGLDVRY